MLLSINWAAPFLVAMYVVSGATKVASLGASEAERLASATGLALRRARGAVLLAGAWELVGAGLVLYGVWVQHGAAVQHEGVGLPRRARQVRALLPHHSRRRAVHEDAVRRLRQDVVTSDPAA